MRNTSFRTCTLRLSWREATDKLRAAAKKNNVILGLFLFGTSRVGEFLDKGIPIHQPR